MSKVEKGFRRSTDYTPGCDIRILLYTALISVIILATRGRDETSEETVPLDPTIAAIEYPNGPTLNPVSTYTPEPHPIWGSYSFNDEK